MSSIDKLYEKMKRSPHDIRFPVFEKIMKHYGFSCIPGKGDHVVFFHPGLPANFFMPVDTRGKHKPLDIKAVKNAIACIEELKECAD